MAKVLHILVRAGHHGVVVLTTELFEVLVVSCPVFFTPCVPGELNKIEHFDLILCERRHVGCFLKDAVGLTLGHHPVVQLAVALIPGFDSYISVYCFVMKELEQHVVKRSCCTFNRKNGFLIFSGAACLFGRGWWRRRQIAENGAVCHRFQQLCLFLFEGCRGGFAFLWHP